MTEKLTARIENWDSEKGYGFLRVGPRRVFIHIRDFAERHKTPEVGDVIRFSLGTDTRGRVCAKEAVHNNDGGRFQRNDLMALVALVCLPGFALHHLQMNQPLLWGFAFAISIITYLSYSMDKSRARARDWRIPETTLHFLEASGGWPGAFIAHRRLRHKSAKTKFQVVFWLIVGTYQYVAVDYLLDWRLSRRAWTTATSYIAAKSS